MDASLYQIAKDSQKNSEPITISLVAFKFLLSSLIDVAIAQHKSASFWLKLPTGEVWQGEIERYHRQAGCYHKIYCCLYDPAVWQNLTNSQSPDGVILPVALDRPNLWRGEYFIIILAAGFNLAVIAQRISTSGENTHKRAQLSTIITSDPETLSKICSALKEALPIAPDLDILESIENASSSSQTSIVTQMLLQVLYKQDEARQASPKIVAPEESLPAFTGFIPTATLINQLLEELRTPLTTMKTALKLVGAESLKPPQRQRYVQMLDVQCDRQTSLVTGLLEFLQLQQATEQASPQPLKLSDIIPVVVSTYQPLAQEKGIQLGYTVPEKLPAISGFEPWLKQIVIHLLHNSIKFTRPGGRVSVVATEKDQFVELEVRDTGISISTNDLPKIFDWFYRTKTTGGEENTGAGIGLAIVQNLLQGCGGSISVTSKVGLGSSFKVLLPIYHV
ncbi:ATP-binding protein [Merismopedia glauca]|nr:ATP-binding protein [Merismopedia glauca]